MNPTARECLCLALDRVNRDQIEHLTEALHHDIGCFKINAAFVQYGPELVQTLTARGVGVFLDLKFHDIPATVATHVGAAAALGVDWLTVHASGGRAMMQAAAEAAHQAAQHGKRPRILAVTILTSLDQTALNTELRIPGPLEDHVFHLATEALECGLDGIVCSAAELPALRKQFPPEFAMVTPGIAGLSTSAGSDQKRVADPVSAIRDGATMLVIGRAILNAANPVVIAAEIRRAIEKVL